MKHLTLFAFLAAGLILSGCADDKPKGELPPLHPVKGKALRGGSPVTGGTVQFLPEPAKPEFTDLLINSTVNPDGTFELQTIHTLSMKKAAGAPAGTYKALVTLAAPAGQQQSSGLMEAPKPVTVTTGPNEVTIELPAGRK